MTDTVQLTLELPRQLLSTFRQEPEAFLAAMRLAAAVKWYETQQVSQAKAAAIAGLSRAEFLDALGRFGVTPFQTTVDELIREAESLYDA
jgi:predicted HTH domain antitoxin